MISVICSRFTFVIGVGASSSRSHVRLMFWVKSYE